MTSLLNIEEIALLLPICTKELASSFYYHDFDREKGIHSYLHYLKQLKTNIISFQPYKGDISLTFNFYPLGRNSKLIRIETFLQQGNKKSICNKFICYSEPLNQIQSGMKFAKYTDVQILEWWHDFIDEFSYSFVENIDIPVGFMIIDESCKLQKDSSCRIRVVRDSQRYLYDWLINDTKIENIGRLYWKRKLLLKVI